MCEFRSLDWPKTRPIESYPSVSVTHTHLFFRQTGLTRNYRGSTSKSTKCHQTRRDINCVKPVSVPYRWEILFERSQMHRTAFLVEFIRFDFKIQWFITWENAFVSNFCMMYTEQYIAKSIECLSAVDSVHRKRCRSTRTARRAQTLCSLTCVCRIECGASHTIHEQSFECSESTQQCSLHIPFTQKRHTTLSVCDTVAAERHSQSQNGFNISWCFWFSAQFNVGTGTVNTVCFILVRAAFMCFVNVLIHSKVKYTWRFNAYTLIHFCRRRLQMLVSRINRLKCLLSFYLLEIE